MTPHHAQAWPSNDVRDSSLEIVCPTHGTVHKTKSSALADLAVRKHEKDFHPRNYQKLYA
jgi:hypothetical protein